MNAQHDVRQSRRHAPQPTARERLVAATTAKERRLEVGGVSTAVLQGGEGPPIMFLQAEFAAMWVRVMPELMRTHHVVAPDLPGLGASIAPEGRLDTDTVVAWLGDLIDQTCASKPVIIGKHLGGALAARFAVHHSGRLRGLVLVDSLGLGPFRPPPAMALTFLRVMLRPTERGLERSLRNYCFVDFDGVRADMGQTYQWIADYALDRFRTPTVRAAMRRLMKTFGSVIPPADLDGITVPTSLIWGRHDLGARLPIAEAASNRHGWPLHVIDDARDDPALEQPDAFLDALRTAIPTSDAPPSSFGLV